MELSDYAVDVCGTRRTLEIERIRPDPQSSASVFQNVNSISIFLGPIENWWHTQPNPAHLPLGKRESSDEQRLNNSNFGSLRGPVEEVTWEILDRHLDIDHRMGAGREPTYLVNREGTRHHFKHHGGACPGCSEQFRLVLAEELFRCEQSSMPLPLQRFAPPPPHRLLCPASKTNAERPGHERAMFGGLFEWAPVMVAETARDRDHAAQLPLAVHPCHLRPERPISFIRVSLYPEQEFWQQASEIEARSILLEGLD
jgi:hypothetical protein